MKSKVKYYIELVHFLESIHRELVAMFCITKANEKLIPTFLAIYCCSKGGVMQSPMSGINKYLN